LPVASNRSLEPNAPLSLALPQTPAAIAHIKQLAEKDSASAYKLGVSSRGCNGLSYTLDPLTGPPARGDDEIDVDGTRTCARSLAAAPMPRLTRSFVRLPAGIKLVIDAKALTWIIGTTIDYSESQNRLGHEFVYINPNAKGVCGCGESFTA